MTLVPQNDETREQYIDRCVYNDELIAEYPEPHEREELAAAGWRKALKG